MNPDARKKPHLRFFSPNSGKNVINLKIVKEPKSYCHKNVKFSDKLGIHFLGLDTGTVPSVYIYVILLKALIDWFPDKKGLASGLVIAGFGSGALFFTPMMNMMTSKFSVLPTFLGSSLEVVLEGGKQFATVGGKLQAPADGSKSIFMC